MKEPNKPHALLDALTAEFNLKNDAAIARFLNVEAPVISKIRNGKQAFTAERMLRVYDATGWDIPKIRGLLA